MAGQTGHRARPSLAGRRGKLAQGPTQHNGLSHVACPQAAAKALLVAPLHATPVMSCAHLPCACGPLLTACSNKPHARSHLVGAVAAGAATASVLVRRVPRSSWCWPRPPAVGQALTRLWPAPGQARPPPRGSLLPGAWVLWRWPAWCRCPHRSRLAGASPRKPSPGARTPSLLGGEGAAAVPGSKGRLRAAWWRWPMASLDSLTPPPPMSLMRGGVALHARRAGYHPRRSCSPTTCKPKGDSYAP
jgi:hypothetical protein